MLKKDKEKEFTYLKAFIGFKRPRAYAEELGLTYVDNATLLDDLLKMSAKEVGQDILPYHLRILKDNRIRPMLSHKGKLYGIFSTFKPNVHLANILNYFHSQGKIKAFSENDELLDEPNPFKGFDHFGTYGTYIVEFLQSELAELCKLTISPDTGITVSSGKLHRIKSNYKSYKMKDVDAFPRKEYGIIADTSDHLYLLNAIGRDKDIRTIVYDDTKLSIAGNSTKLYAKLKNYDTIVEDSVTDFDIDCLYCLGFKCIKFQLNLFPEKSKKIPSYPNLYIHRTAWHYDAELKKYIPFIPDPYEDVYLGEVTTERTSIHSSLFKFIDADCYIKVKGHVLNLNDVVKELNRYVTENQPLELIMNVNYHLNYYSKTFDDHCNWQRCAEVMAKNGLGIVPKGYVGPNFKSRLEALAYMANNIVVDRDYINVLVALYSENLKFKSFQKCPDALYFAMMCFITTKSNVKRFSKCDESFVKNLVCVGTRKTIQRYADVLMEQCDFNDLRLVNTLDDQLFPSIGYSPALNYLWSKYGETDYTLQCCKEASHYLYYNNCFVQKI